MLLSGIILLLPQTAKTQENDFEWAISVDDVRGSYTNITADNQENSYVTGTFSGTVTFGTTTLNGSTGNCFITKLDPDGNFLWANSIQVDLARIEGIEVDSQGNSYIIGSFEDTATFGNIELIGTGGVNVFVAKLNASGNFVWATNTEKPSGWGISNTKGFGISVDNQGNPYITGSVLGGVNFGTISVINTGSDYNVFISKLDTNGNFLWASSSIGNIGDAVGKDVSVDSQGNSYVIGDFENTVTFGSTELESTVYNRSDVFITKLDTNGNFIWAKSVQGSNQNHDYGNSISVDNQGNSYITGSFRETATFGATSLTSYGAADIFVAKLDASGNFNWAVQAGGNGIDSGSSIDIDNQGNCYLTGRFFAGTATFGNFTFTSGELGNAFITKVDATNGNFDWATSVGNPGSYQNMGFGISADDQGYGYVVGYFGGSTATFGNIQVNGTLSELNIFIAKLNKYTLSTLENNYTTLILFPNPAQDQISINNTSNSDITQVEIYNLLGVKVDEITINSQEAVIDVSTLTTGTYFLRIYADSGVVTKKIIKQ